MSYKVFISYSTKDLLIVNHVRRLLTSASIEVYVADYSLPPGAAIGQEIIQAIRSCDLFILLWSHNSRASDWVQQEIGIATDAEKIIIPVVLQPRLELPAFISNRKYLVAYQNPEGALPWLRAHIIERAEKQRKINNVVALGLGAAFIWMLTQDRKDDD